VKVRVWNARERMNGGKGSAASGRANDKSKIQGRARAGKPDNKKRHEMHVLFFFLV